LLTNAQVIQSDKSVDRNRGPIFLCKAVPGCVDGDDGTVRIEHRDTVHDGVKHTGVEGFAFRQFSVESIHFSEYQLHGVANPGNNDGHKRQCHCQKPKVMPQFIGKIIETAVARKTELCDHSQHQRSTQKKKYARFKVLSGTVQHGQSQNHHGNDDVLAVNLERSQSDTVDKRGGKNL